VNIFPLLDSKKTFPYLILLSIWNVSILLGFSSIFFRVKHPRIFQIFLLIFVISYVIWIIGNLLIKKYKIIGTIEIRKDLIIVNNKELSSYCISKIENLVLRYGGTKGDSHGTYLGLLRINDGSNNSISIKYEGESIKFCFLVTRKFFLNSLFHIFKNWEQHGLNFRIIDTNKLEITEKVLKRFKSNYSHFQKNK